MVDDDSAEWARFRTGFESRTQVLAQRVVARISAIDRTTVAESGHLSEDVTEQVTQMLAASGGTRAAPTTEAGRAHLRTACTRFLKSGVPIEDLLRGLRIALEEGMSLTEQLADEQGIGNATRGLLVRRLLAWSDLAMSIASEAHHDLTAPIAERLRRYGPMLRRLRAGQRIPEDVDLLASAAGGSSARYSTLVARLPAAVGTTAVRMVDELTGRGALVAYDDDDDVIALVPDPPRSIADVTAGVGPMVATGDLAGSFRLADRALSTALALGWTGIHRFDDLGVLPAVVADQEVARALARRFLEPCAAVQGGVDLIATVSVYLRCEASVSRAAEALAVHENTLRYRLARFERITGASLRDTRTRAEVWWVITSSALSEQRR